MDRVCTRREDTSEPVPAKMQGQPSKAMDQVERGGLAPIATAACSVVTAQLEVDRKLLNEIDEFPDPATVPMNTYGPRSLQPKPPSSIRRPTALAMNRDVEGRTATLRRRWLGRSRATLQ